MTSFAKILKGDVDGHPFRGNQYTHGDGDTTDLPKGMERPGKNTFHGDNVAQEDVVAFHRTLEKQGYGFDSEYASNAAPGEGYYDHPTKGGVAVDRNNAKYTATFHPPEPVMTRQASVQAAMMNLHEDSQALLAAPPAGLAKNNWTNNYGKKRR